MINKILIVAVLLFSSIGLLAQQEDDHNHDHHHHHHDHDHDHDHGDGHHHRNEIGIANSPIYFLKEKEFTYGLHAHLIHQIDGGDFGIGLGYERIFNERKQNTIGIIGSFRNKAWVFNVSPGITFEESFDNDLNFAIHFESTYEFSLGDLHLGPVFEIAYDPNDIHLGLGLHIGYGF